MRRMLFAFTLVSVLSAFVFAQGTDDCLGTAVSPPFCITGTTIGYDDLFDCNGDDYGFAGNDVAYCVTGLTIGKTYRFIGVAAYDADWAVSASCGHTAGEIVCTDYSGEALPSCDSGGYHHNGSHFDYTWVATQNVCWVWIDGYYSYSYGEYTFEIIGIADPGDACSNPYALNCGDSLVSSDLTGTENYYSDWSACPGGPIAVYDGGDEVWELELDGVYDVTVALKDTANPAMDLFITGGGCDVVCPTPCVSWDDNAATVVAVSGVLYVIVDTTAGNEAAYDLSVACVLRGDDCEDPIPIDCNTCNYGRIDAYAPDHDCSPDELTHRGNDVVYQFDIVEDSIITFIGEADFDADWTIASVCDAETGDILCVDKLDPETDPSCCSINSASGGYVFFEGVVTAALSPYYIWVDVWYEYRDGEYAFDINSIPIGVEGENCTNVHTAACSDSYMADLRDMFLDDWDETDYGCNPGGSTHYDGKDEIFEFTLDSPQAVTINLIGPEALDIFLDDSCNPDGFPVACGEETISVNCLSAGKHYIIVDCPAGDEAAYALEITCSTCPGENCSDPIPVSCGDCVNGSTTAYANDHNCGTGHYGPDVVYVIQDFNDNDTIRLVCSADYDADWTLATSCQPDDADILDPPGCTIFYGSCENTSCSTFDEPEFDGRFTFEFTATEPEYYLWVDGFDSFHKGNYSFETTSRSGVDCADAHFIDCGDTVTDITSGKGNSIDSATYGSQCDLGDAVGDDVWYHVGVMGIGMTIDVNITIGDVDVYILAGCDRCVACGDSGASFTSVTGKEDIHIVIDHNSGAGGAYIFEATCDFAGPVVGNLVCEYPRLTNAMPVDDYYNYSEIQYLLPGEEIYAEIDEDYIINGIGWHCCEGILDTGRYMIDVYMQEIQENIDVCFDPIASDAMTKVATNIPISGSGWITVPITPFTYHAGNNLVISVCDNQDGYSEGIEFACSHKLNWNGNQRYSRTAGPFDGDLTTTCDDEFGPDAICSENCVHRWLTTGIFGRPVADPTATPTDAVTYTPSPTDTPTPTCGTGTPTDTPTPTGGTGTPTDTPTPTPTGGTEEPTDTPTPTPTGGTGEPTDTPTPVPDLFVSIDLNQAIYDIGDQMIVTAGVKNEREAFDSDVYVAVYAMEKFFFWPAFGEDPVAARVTIDAGLSIEDVTIFSMQVGDWGISELTWYFALTEPGNVTILALDSAYASLHQAKSRVGRLLD